MKLQKREHVDGLEGFKNPEDGWHNILIQEGIERYAYEKNSGASCRMVWQTIDEEEEIAFSTFETMLLPSGDPFKNWEKKIEGILTVTGLLDDFNAKLPNDCMVSDQKFVDALAMKLPGKKLSVRTELTSYMTKADPPVKKIQCNIMEIAAYGEGSVDNGDGSKPVVKDSAATDEAW